LVHVESFFFKLTAAAKQHFSKAALSAATTMINSFDRFHIRARTETAGRQVLLSAQAFWLASKGMHATATHSAKLFTV
jgi:hypothetical protein